ncbi:aspartate dehydrogenase [Lachnospiraceae bacterium 38-10]
MKVDYDRENQRPVIRASICNGEQVAGFKDIRTGKFSEVMLIRDDRDLAEFLERYGIVREDVKKEY